MATGPIRWKSRGVIVTIIILASTITIAVAASVTLIPKPPCANVQGAMRVFTIVVDQNGYNGSVARGGTGPFITVNACDSVVLNFMNRDVQAHGLSVDFYATSGLEAVGGDSATFRFLAFKPGEFRVFCNTLCSIHNYMQNARLTVESCSTGCSS